jgi:hypothetical protein
MPPLAIVGGLAAAGSLAGGVIQGNAAKDAAKTQADAAEKANDLQYQMYLQNRADQEPWRNAGVQALSQLQDPSFQKTFSMSDFQTDPGYDFRMQEGQKALERSAAAKGGLQSGAFAKALNRYGQDYASNEYGKVYDRFNNDQSLKFNRLSSLAGLGQTANGQIGQYGSNYANQASQNITGAANAQGAAGIAGANGWANSLGGLGRTGMDLYAMNNQNNWMNQWSNNQNAATPSNSYFSGSYGDVSKF